MPGRSCCGDVADKAADTVGSLDRATHVLVHLHAMPYWAWIGSAAGTLPVWSMLEQAGDVEAEQLDSTVAVVEIAEV